MKITLLDSPVPVNELGFDEVVDTFSDAFEIAIFVEDRLKDGPGLDDFIAAFPQFPKLAEIYNDRKIFAAQMVDLTTEEAKEAVRAIAERVGVSESVVAQKGTLALAIAARIYKLYRDSREEAELIVRDIRNLFGTDKAVAIA